MPKFLERNNNYLILRKLWKHTSIKNRKRIYLAFILMILSGICEVVTLAALLPFLNILTNAEKYLSNNFFIFATNFLKISLSESNIFILVTVFFCIAVILSSCIRLINLFFLNNTSAAIGIEISSKIYKNILSQDLEFYFDNESSAIFVTVTTFIGDAVAFISSFLLASASFAIIIFIALGLLIGNPFIAIISIGLFLPIYFYISKATKRRLKLNSKTIASLRDLQIKQVQNSLGAIRKILMHGHYKIYRDLYNQTDFRVRTKISQNLSLGSFPRYLLEGIGIIFVALFSLISGLVSKNNDQILTTLGLLAVSIQKILPAMQFIYNCLTNMRGLSSSVEEVIKLLDLKTQNVNKNFNYKTLDFNNLRLSKLSYKFPNTKKEIIKDLSLKINKGERIGIVGKTGSGKSTLVDLLIGLLKPTKGNVLINDINIHKNEKKLCNWMNSIAHVPQNVFVTNDSIENNIIFGFRNNEIDNQKLKRCIKIAQLNKFIETLPLGTKTLIGESGSKLSGGQRQRIGIARALYKECKILILDEATSALDVITEASLINEISKLNKNLTVIIIAHRLSTLKLCDSVIEIKDGKIVNNNENGSILNIMEKKTNKKNN